MEGKKFKDVSVRAHMRARPTRHLPDRQTGLQSHGHNGFLEWLHSPMGVASGLGLVLILAIGASTFFEDNFELIKNRLYEMIELVYSKVFGT